MSDQQQDYQTTTIRVLTATSAVCMFFFTFVGAAQPVVLTFCLVLLGLGGAFATHNHKPEQTWLLSVARSVFVATMVLIPIGLHASTTLAVKDSIRTLGLDLCDESLLRTDSKLFGWIFSQGQLSLWSQHTPIFSADSFFGRFVTEILQISYFSYYFWPNLFGGWMLYLVLTQEMPTRATLSPEDGETRDQTQHLWVRLHRFLSGLVAVHCLSAFLNFVIPAATPNIHLSSQFAHKQPQGIFLTSLLRAVEGDSSASAVNELSSFGSFPSIRCGVMWYTALVAFRLGFPRFAKWATFFAVLMGWAVLFLRYHYLIDVLCSFFLVLGGLAAADALPTEFDAQRPFASVVYAPLG